MGPGENEFDNPGLEAKQPHWEQVLLLLWRNTLIVLMFMESKANILFRNKVAQGKGASLLTRNSVFTNPQRFWGKPLGLDSG